MQCSTARYTVYVRYLGHAYIVHNFSLESNVQVNFCSTQLPPLSKDYSFSPPFEDCFRQGAHPPIGAVTRYRSFRSHCRSIRSRCRSVLVFTCQSFELVCSVESTLLWDSDLRGLCVYLPVVVCQGRLKKNYTLGLNITS